MRNKRIIASSVGRRVKAAQAKMLGLAGTDFSATELQHLCVLVRLTTEFHGFLRRGKPELIRLIKRRHPGAKRPIGTYLRDQGWKYATESTLSGLDSFISVNSAFRVLVGAPDSDINWSSLSVKSLTALFFDLYRKFQAANNFLRKCRLLLDVFKLQIVIAGVKI